jgi:DNA-nicking Smr family endonuclease
MNEELRQPSLREMRE